MSTVAPALLDGRHWVARCPRCGALHVHGAGDARDDARRYLGSVAAACADASGELYRLTEARGVDRLGILAEIGRTFESEPARRMGRRVECGAAGVAVFSRRVARRR